MSHTILTIPFNLKEKTEGDFLKKGFVFDEVFSNYFENQSHGNAFLHYFNFDPNIISLIAKNLFLHLNFPNSNLPSQSAERLYVETNFFDKKHLKSARGYIKGIVETEINKKRDVINCNRSGEEIPIDLISEKFKFSYTKEVTFDDKTKTTISHDFSIDAINLYVNKSELTKYSIGYGFLQIVIKWDFENAKSMIHSLEPISELFRYYKGGVDRNNKFKINWNDVIIDKIQNLEKKIKNNVVKQNHEYVKFDKDKIEKYNKWIIKDDTKKINFKLLIDKLLEQINPNISEMFDFENEDIIKPYVLHLSTFKQKNQAVDKDLESIDIIKKAFRMIRISGSENTEINSSSKLEFTYPDYYTSQFVLNEGAFVIEGIEQSTDLINKYYPSFLFALNQKYLFNYMQEKINELPLIKKDNLIKYSAEDLKELQQTMINAEFSQIFTSLSNYNEIDMFFEKLREQFKIKQLKEEYFDSINGISKITQLNENEKKEEIEKLNSGRLNLILLLLTIAQVWPNILGIFSNEKETQPNFKVNIIFYSILVLIGITFYYIILPLKSENKLNRKDFFIKLKSFISSNNRKNN
jgi:hypothetical protein